MEKENYILLNIEYSNGLPYVEYKEFSDFSKAESAFNIAVSKAKKDYDEYEESKNDNTNYLCSYFADSNNMKGNGILIAITTENNILNEIINAVDKSEKTTPYHRLDNELSIYNVPILDINMPWFEDILNDENSEYNAYIKVNYIVKRPSFDEVDNFIYDVYMNVQYNNSEGSTSYCESLELIPIEILMTIYKYNFL